MDLLPFHRDCRKMEKQVWNARFFLILATKYNFFLIVAFRFALPVNHHVPYGATSMKQQHESAIHFPASLNDAHLIESSPQFPLFQSE